MPFGLRIEDDNAFVRQATGMNFLTPDDGVEVGLELAKWSAQLAVIEGAGADSDGTMSALPPPTCCRSWRVGASVNTSDDAFGDREMDGVFAGLKTGPISWLAEVDFIGDDFRPASRDLMATLLEGNWRLRKGHNLKVSYEYLEPDDDRDEDEQERYSVVWEYYADPVRAIARRLAPLQRHSELPDQQSRRALRASYTSTSDGVRFGEEGSRPRSREAGFGSLERPGGSSARASAQTIAMRLATGSAAFGRRTVSTPSATLAPMASLSIFVDSVNVRTKLPTLYSE